MLVCRTLRHLTADRPRGLRSMNRRDKRRRHFTQRVEYFRIIKNYTILGCVRFLDVVASYQKEGLEN